MANNLQVNEGTSGKFVRTIDTGSGVHVPLDGLILDDGNGSWSPIQRRANAIRMSLENDEVGIASENTLSSIDSAIGDHTTASEVRDPSTAATLLERVTGVDSMIWDALAGGNATDQLRVDLENENADLLTETKFDSVINGSGQLKTDTSVSVSSLLAEAKDQSGTNQPIEVVDDGSGNMLLRVQLENDAAGLLTESRFEDVVNGSNELKTNTSVSISQLQIEADDGTGNTGVVHRDGNSLQTAIETWNAAAIPVDATGQGDVPITLDSEDVAVGSLPSLPAGSNNIGSVDVVNSVLVQGEDGSSTAQPLPLTTVNGSLGLRVFDQLAIQAADNQIQSVPDTDRVVAGSSLSSTSTAHATHASNSETSIVSSGGGNIRVLSYKVQSKGSGQVVAELRDGSAGTVLNQVACASFGDGAVEKTSQGYLFETTGNDLYLHLDAAIEVSIRLTYVEA